MLELADKDCGAVIVTVFSGIKENMLIMNEKIGHLSR